jgi:transcriptional regulator of acetoin/glycerol metabolism
MTQSTPEPGTNNCGQCCGCRAADPRRLLSRFQNKPTHLARALDIHRATLRKRLREHGGPDTADDEPPSSGPAGP